MEHQKEQVADTEGRTSPTSMFNPFYTGRPRTPVNGGIPGTIDRQRIINRIKSGERQTHSPVRPPSYESQPSYASSQEAQEDGSPACLLPSPVFERRDQPRKDEISGNLASGMEILRPRSALHKGDFRDEQNDSWRYDSYRDSPYPRKQDVDTPLSTSPVAPWHADFPRIARRHFHSEAQPATSPFAGATPGRPRAVSQANSISGSFTYQPPTSPLVYQANAADIPDGKPFRRRSPSPEKNRRYTFSPRSLQNFDPAFDYPASARYNRNRPLPSIRREGTFPYQAHQPRRSVTHFNSLPHTPVPGQRRPSISDGSPLHHAPMVGSYEESILRGRMSTTPSRPLNFVAQIGVLGKGNCKPSLKCPPHVTVPFPAVFYSYASHQPQATSADAQPSPYVGLVDLEHSLQKPEKRDSSRRRRHHDGREHDALSRSHCQASHEGVHEDEQHRQRRQQKRKRRSESPKEPPGGAYRIPQQGQIQIVIKNPNKTAVKLFLVPYDLSDMEPGQKTFIRQRSYSAGPIIDMPADSRKNFGTDRPEASLCATSDPKDRPMLRYLVHLHICCPAKDRYYLYKSIRVVFANRVPDGKERLRNEVQMPEPRYSVYKVSRDSNVGLAPPQADVSHRRRSAIIYPSDAFFGALGDQIPQVGGHELQNTVASSFPYGGSYQFPQSAQSQSRAYRSHNVPNLDSRPGSKESGDRMDVGSLPTDNYQSPTSPSSPSQYVKLGRLSQLASRPGSSTDGSYETLSFSRESSRERTNGRSESLLSRRLKDLEVKSHNTDGGTL